MPDRVTFDISHNGRLDPRVQEAVDQAFWEDGHILLLAPMSGVQQRLNLAVQDLSSYAMQQRAASPASAGSQRPSSARRQAGKMMLVS